jgi:hypothetical protein
VHQRAVEAGQPLEVELLQRLGGAELRAAQAQLNFFCSRRATSSPMSRARNSV